MSGYVYAEHGGGLLLAERAADTEAIRRALKRLDRDLILTRDFDSRFGQVVYQVRHRVSADRPPLLVLEWRSADGRPRPLSFGLLDELKRQECRARELYAAADARNEQRIAEQHRRLEEELEEVANEVGPWGSDVRAACFPRGVYLRQARDRQRSQGRNI